MFGGDDYLFGKIIAYVLIFVLICSGIIVNKIDVGMFVKLYLHRIPITIQNKNVPFLCVF